MENKKGRIDKWKEALTVFCSSLNGGEIQKPTPGKNDFLNVQIQQNRMQTIHELQFY